MQSCTNRYSVQDERQTVGWL